MEINFLNERMEAEFKYFITLIMKIIIKSNRIDSI